MQASALDLRYKTRQIIQALERNEEVRIFYRGKLKGVIQAADPKRKIKNSSTTLFSECPGMPAKAWMRP